MGTFHYLLCVSSISELIRIAEWGTSRTKEALLFHSLLPLCSAIPPPKTSSHRLWGTCSSSKECADWTDCNASTGACQRDFKRAKKDRDMEYEWKAVAFFIFFVSLNTLCFHIPLLQVILLSRLHENNPPWQHWLSLIVASQFDCWPYNRQWKTGKRETHIAWWKKVLIYVLINGYLLKPIDLFFAFSSKLASLSRYCCSGEFAWGFAAPRVSCCCAILQTLRWEDALNKIQPSAKFIQPKEFNLPPFQGWTHK